MCFLTSARVGAYWSLLSVADQNMAKVHVPESPSTARVVLRTGLASGSEERADRLSRDHR
ncbi:hypothetical protein UA75_27915 [Actinoalloteichus sp. GBA129-24]|uniref:Uncharacterized protein n=1 Tax=Actinoalloteichus fjordicus TaxID=1612552 RepID=A0AAC9LIQ3_9PSEU|nr:hypothetical protein UA74_27370 [Actinoalloteichus fjordicus]APU23554.1 hypothetical protein UA75_27915 [Actinoalloteichus sp. GBA129-24]